MSYEEAALRCSLARAGRARVVRGRRLRQRRQRARARAAAATTDASASRRASKGGTLTCLVRRRRRLHGPGPDVLHVRLQVGYAVNRPLYSFKPEDSSKQIPDLADGEPQIAARRQDDDGQASSRASSSRRRSTARSSPTTSSTPSSARSARTSRTATRRSTSATSSARREADEGHQGHLGHHDAGRPRRSCSSSRRRPRGAGLAGARDADHDAGAARSTPRSSTQDAVDVRPVRRLHRPVHGQERQRRASSTGWEPGKSDRLVRNPNWDKSTDFRPAYLDSIDDRGGQRRRRRSPARRILQGSAARPGRRRRRRRVLKQALTQLQGPAHLRRRRGGTRYIALNTHDQAVRQPQRPQGGRRGDRPQRAAPDARRRDHRRRSRDELPPAGLPGLRGGRRPQAAGRPRLPAEPEQGDLALAEVHVRRRRPGYPPDGKYTGDGQDPHAVATNADPGKKTAEVAQAQLEKLGFKVNFRIVPQDTLYTKFCNVPASRTSRSARTSGWFKDFLDPQSLLDADVQRQEHHPAGQRQLAAARRPGDQRAMTTASATPAGRGARPGLGRHRTTRSPSRPPASRASGTRQPVIASKDVEPGGRRLRQLARSWRSLSLK